MDKSSGNKTSEIAGVLRAKIENGVYPYGTTIPTVRTLAQKLEVSPQTASKAVSLLVDLGYVVSRRGSGTVVVYKKDSEKTNIGMLIDEGRSSFLKHLDDPTSYHSKDIYLSYMLHMTSLNLSPRFIKYSRNVARIPSGIQEELRSFAGLIVQGTLPPIYTDFIAGTGIPTVLMNREVPNNTPGRWGEVIIDLNRVSDALNYLGSLGHSKILYLIPEYLSDHTVIKNRYAAFFHAAEDTFTSRPFDLKITYLSSNPQNAAAQIKELLKDGYTASIGFNDIASFALYQILHELHLRVPDDFSIIGFDDLFMAKLAVPPLTTLRVPREELVKKAFTLLEELQQATQPNLVLREAVNVELIIRRSAFMNTKEFPSKTK